MVFLQRTQAGAAQPRQRARHADDPAAAPGTLYGAGLVPTATVPGVPRRMFRAQRTPRTYTSPASTATTRLLGYCRSTARHRIGRCRLRRIQQQQITAIVIVPRPVAV